MEMIECGKVLNTHGVRGEIKVDNYCDEGFYKKIKTVFVGGTSSFDMAPAPYNKYYALDKIATERGYSHDEVVFVGDDYGQGGNDESVYRSDFHFVCVDDYTRLPEYMAKLLASREWQD